MLWKDTVKTAKEDSRFSIKSGYKKSMKKDDYYSDKIKIKDSITGIITEFSWDYYRKGVLMASSNQKIEEELNKDLWDCPQCGRHTMEQVQFSTYSA